MNDGRGLPTPVPVGDPGWDPARLALVDPLRYADLLAGYRLLLRSSTDIGDALARAESGQEPDENLLDLDDPEIAAAFIAALNEVWAERERRECDRRKVDLAAAGLLAIARVYHDPWTSNA